MRIYCRVKNVTMLECVWPDHNVEYFHIDSDILKGTINPDILGYPSEDGCLITWSSGNIWTKEGN